MECHLTVLAPDGTAVVKDANGNILATEKIPSGESKDIIVQIMINVLKGDFTGEFDLSVQDQQGFYNDYTDGVIISSLSIATDPKLGSFATVRILGGLLATDAIPVTWDGYNDLTISQDPTKFNVIMIVYGNNASNSDIRITNTIIDAPDLIAPTFVAGPTATNIQENSFDITAQLNENGTVYGYLVADGSPAPTVQEIIDNAQSQFTDSGSGGTLSFTGLVVDTNYDVYVVAEDTAGNKQASPVLVEVLTNSIDYVIWEQLLNATTIGTGTISANPPLDAGYSNGGYSTRALNGNGYIEFKGDSSVGDGGQGVGLTNTYGGIATDLNDMDIWIQLRQDGAIRVLESGVVVFPDGIETWQPSDIIRIDNTSGSITVLKNGNLIYTSGLSFTLPLTAIALFILEGSEIREAIWVSNNLITSPL